MHLFRYNHLYFRIVVSVLLSAAFLSAGCASRKSETTEPVASATEPPEQTVPETGTGSANAIHAVDVTPSQETVEVRIRGREKLTYTSIKQDFPFGIAVYLPDTRIDPGLPVDLVDDNRVGSVRISYADEEQTTAKVEILLNEDMTYVVAEEGADLNVVLAETSAPEADGSAVSSETRAYAADPSESKQAEPAPSDSDTPALMTGIQFNTAETGQSDIMVETSHPVAYDVVWKSDDQMNLRLFNTRIPGHHQRPLLTQYFNSAVEQIRPGPDPESAADATVEIRIREKVPFRIVQDRTRISLFFDPAGSSSPPQFDKAVKQVRQGETESVSQPPVPESGTPTPGDASAVESTATSDTLDSTAQPRYTGEKIKLDFYDTDIKNVFRILRTVSGLNFAVDQDVSGKVTMTLEEPVPWDQVLDLVLKMNGLGKKLEGNVVRIATLATITAEEQALQAALAARKKAEEQKKSLEPLFTEYIPINYSDAATDIQPHISNMLTADRGSVSVDSRTNMLIVTDTQEKIDQIHEMVFRLDKVTPQIIIGAKVVEVTKEFSRSIGIGWNLSNSTVSGFVDDFDISVNDPSGTGIAGEFSFFRLFGSSVTALNAKLEASEEQGDARIVSSPRILTLDNKKAMIKQGFEVGYSAGADDNGNPTIEFKDVDLLLEVTPHVTPDQRISMSIHLTKNDISGYAGDVPSLTTNEAETELLVNNNDTVVIGGVVKVTKTNDDDGLPFLTGIPVLGALFGTKTVSDDRSELLIFLTPTIVQLEQKRNVTTAIN